MAKTAIFLADGYEEIEALAVVDIFRRAGIELDMISVSDELLTNGSHGIQVMADMLLKDVDFDVNFKIYIEKNNLWDSWRDFEYHRLYQDAVNWCRKNHIDSNLIVR